MRIETLDTSDDVRLREAYDLHRRAHQLGREGSPFWSWEEMRGEFRTADPGERLVVLGGLAEPDDGAAAAPGTLLGIGYVWLPLLDNLDKAWLSVDVDPAHARRGHGTQLAGALVELCRAEGRREVLAEVKIPFAERETHGYRRFAERLGATLANVEVVRYLDLPVPGDRVEQWAATAAERAAGYTIETHVDVVPDELVPSLCVLLGQLGVDAPTGAVDWEEEVMTPERFRSLRAELVAAGRTMLETVALTPERQVVAQSTLAVPLTGRTDVSQWGTFVHREHRGHRLGLAVKAAALAHLQAHHPQMRRIVTQNAETNDHMVAINELMGFVPVETSTEMLLRV